MNPPLRLLIIDDQQPDAELSARQIARGGYPCTWRRVETEEGFREQLREFTPHLILSDCSMPQYDGLSALELALHEAPDVPFIFVSGTLGEKRAAEALARGATDYISKGDLTRLVPAVARVINETVEPEIREAHAERVRRLTGALQMLSGMRAASITTHTRSALLANICRILHGANQYEYSFIALANPHTHTAHAVAWAGASMECLKDAQFRVSQSDETDTSVVGGVLRTGRSIVCPDIDRFAGPLAAEERSVAQPGSAWISLPLLIGDQSMGALTVGTAARVQMSVQELQLLEELATQISLALQTLPDEGTISALSPVDPVTGLQKRAAFCEHVARFLRGSPEQCSAPTVIVFGIEGLGDLIETHGRHVGDHLLQDLGGRLERRFGEGRVAHLGEGVFAATFDEHRRRPEAEHDSTATIFSHPFSIAGRTVPVTVRSGLARYPRHGEDADTLLQNAECVLWKARERYAAPGHSSNATDARHPGLEQRLRQAFRERQFRVHYQPLIERVSGRVVAVEALLRWEDPERGRVSPGVFLPTLEQCGLMIPVGEWVLSQAVQDLAQWQHIGLPRIRIAVNVSCAELGRDKFAEYFLDAIRLARTAPGIDIEISEGALVRERPNLRRTLCDLRQEGVRVAIDDFGVAHTSPGRLAEFRVDSLKIDRTLVSGLNPRPQSQTVVSSIMDVARAYGLHTIAEGVETIEQLQILDNLGCEQSQGYLHSPAVSAEDLTLLVATRNTELQP
ncbi:MAG TPA: EAL domain-containing protein [Steroidobacteraceae bacterium]|jgi:EAL domain-containing protein (putative c-di-GMP-specific phosphodiesterase class I)/PleD family two-component response regulator